MLITNNQNVNNTHILIHTISSDKLLQFITSKTYRILRHMFTITIFLLFFWKGKIRGEYAGIFDHIEWMSTLIVILSVLYINMYILVPSTLYKGKLFRYILWLFMFSALSMAIFYAMYHFIFSKHVISSSITQVVIMVKTILLFCFVLLLAMTSTALKFVQRWIGDTQRIYELEKRAMASELEALRSQIQPHFLFNMLNSIKILIKREPDQAIDITMKLSDFLRHLLYNGKHSEVYLIEEIRFLDDYLGLEKIRRDEFEYNINYNADQIKGIKIPPNVLLILVENAVKHSIDPSDQSYIDIRVAVVDDFLSFHITNSLPQLAVADDQVGGVGLVNIKRRLSLMYGSEYYLNSTKNKDEYIATLRLPL